MMTTIGVIVMVGAATGTSKLESEPGVRPRVAAVYATAPAWLAEVGESTLLGLATR